MKRPRDSSIPTRFDDLVDSSIVSYPPNDLASLAHLIDSNGERVYIGLPEDLSGKCEVPSGFCTICPRVKGEPRKLNAAGTCTSCQKSAVKPFHQRYEEMDDEEEGEFCVYVILSETVRGGFYVGITEVGVNARLMEHEFSSLSEEQKQYVREARAEAWKRMRVDGPNPYTSPLEWLGPDPVQLEDGKLARRSDCQQVLKDVRSGQLIWAPKFRPALKDPATGEMGQPTANLTRPRDLNGETIQNAQGRSVWMEISNVAGVMNTKTDSNLGQYTNRVQWLMPQNECVRAFKGVKDGVLTTVRPLTVPRAYCTVRLARHKTAPDAPPSAFWVLNAGVEFLPPRRLANKHLKVPENAENPRMVRLDDRGRYQADPTKSTHERGPFILVRTERFRTRRDMRLREDWLHSEAVHADGKICGGRRALKKWLCAWTEVHRPDLNVPIEEMVDFHEAAAPPKCYCARD